MAVDENEAEASPTSRTYCYQLHCIVNIEPTSTAQRMSCVQCKNAVVTVGRNVRRQIVLQVELQKAVGLRRLAYLLEDCRIHGKDIAKGRGSIEIPSKGLVVFLRNCPTQKLNVFMKTLHGKLMLMHEVQDPQMLHTPSNAHNRELLRRLPNVFAKLSPLSIDEIRKLRRMRGKCTAENSAASKDVSATPVRGLQRRALGDLKQLPMRPIAESSNVVQCCDDRSAEMLTLFDEQRSAIKAVVSDNLSVFITGSAGTGKSLLLNKIVALLPTETTFITAATGVAACHVGGMTLHSFAGIGDGSATKEDCVALASRKQVRALWKKCRCLVVDEISMVEAEFFSKIEYVARKIRNSDDPFGGIQLVVTGDFLQLPPIEKAGKPIKFCFESSAWKRCIQKTVLLQQVRRQNDNVFIAILNEIRFGRCPPVIAKRLLETKKNDFAEAGIVPTRLCTHTSDADAVNLHQLELLEGDEKVFEAKDSGTFAASLQFSSPRKLVLKVGAQVMLTKNIDIQRGLNNGARGVVTAFSARGYPIVRFVKNVSAGVEIHPIRFTIRTQRCDNVAMRVQVPLQLAWAISIHKSQGLTLDAVEVCLSRVFAEGQAYVALSRARSLLSIRVISLDPDAVRANQSVVRYYEDLKENQTKRQNIDWDDAYRPRKRSRLLFD